MDTDIFIYYLVVNIIMVVHMIKYIDIIGEVCDKIDESVENHGKLTEQIFEKKQLKQEYKSILENFQKKMEKINASKNGFLQTYNLIAAEIQKF